MDPRRRQGAIDAQLLALRGDIQCAQAKQRAKAKAQARSWILGVSLLRIVVLIYWLADGMVDPAVFYLRQRGRQHRWPDKDDEELADLVEQAFVNTADAEVLALADAEDPLDLAALREATRYGLQWRLRQWTLTQKASHSQLGIILGSSRQGVSCSGTYTCTHFIWYFGTGDELQCCHG